MSLRAGETGWRTSSTWSRDRVLYFHPFRLSDPPSFSFSAPFPRHPSHRQIPVRYYQRDNYALTGKGINYSNSKISFSHCVLRVDPSFSAWQSRLWWWSENANVHRVDQRRRCRLYLEKWSPSNPYHGVVGEAQPVVENRDSVHFHSLPLSTDLPYAIILQLHRHSSLQMELETHLDPA